MKALFGQKKNKKKLDGLQGVEDNLSSIGSLADGGSITSMISLMTPPFSMEKEASQRRAFKPHVRPTKAYRRAYLITTVGRDNLEREILSDPDDPDLNVIIKLGMSFIQAKFGGNITRSGCLLVEWAYLRGLEFTYKEKRIIARAHWEIWQEQGLRAELYHLKRSKDLYEQIVQLPEYADDVTVWTEYLRVLMAMGTRSAKEVSQRILQMAYTNEEQDLAEFNLYCGVNLKEQREYSKASTCLFEAVALGPPRHFRPIEIMFIVARNVNEWDARSKEVRGRHDTVVHDYSSVYQQMITDGIVSEQQLYDDWLHDKTTWVDIADKCAVHGLWNIVADFLGQGLQFDVGSYTDSRMWFRIAKAYFRAGRMPDALSSITQALSHAPHNGQYKACKRIWEAKLNEFEYTINVCCIDEVVRMLPSVHDLHIPAANRIRQLHPIAVKRWDRLQREAEAERLRLLAAETLSGAPVDDAHLNLKPKKDKNKKNPRILWRVSDPIVYPTRLTHKILCAQVKDVAGEFEYKPDLHDNPLPAGTHKLFVEFTPENTTKYNIVEAEVEITVEKALPYVRWNEPPFLYAGSTLTHELHLNAAVCEEQAVSEFAAAATATGGESPSKKRAPSPGKSGSSSKGKNKKGSGGNQQKDSATGADSTRFGMVSRMGAESRIIGMPKGSYTYRLDGPNKTKLNSLGAAMDTLVLPVGKHEVLVTFTPTDSLNYQKATAKTTITVIPKIVPVLCWQPIPAITYQDCLEPIHLCAKSELVPGTFAYFTEVTRRTRRRKWVDEEDQEDAHEGNVEDPSDPVEDKAAGKDPEMHDEDEDEDQFHLVDEQVLLKVELGTVLPAGINKLRCIFDPLERFKYTSADIDNTLLCHRFQTTIAWPEPPCVYAGVRLDFTEHLNASLVEPNVADSGGAGVFTYTATMHAYVPFHSDERDALTEAGGEQRESEADRAHGDTDHFAHTGAALHHTPHSDVSSHTPSGAGSAVSHISYLPKGRHDLHVHYSPLDSSNYLPCTATVPITVRIKPLLQWSKPTFIRFGERLTDEQLNCSTDECPGTFTYDPAYGAKLEIGHYMLRAHFRPDDAVIHDEMHAMVPLSVVRKLVPKLSWHVQDLVFGTPVSEESVLCCTADVPGEFRYNLRVGQMLDAGSHAVIATFVPEDAVTYSNGSTCEQLIVHPLQVAISWDSHCFEAGLMTIAYGTPVSEHQLCALVTFPPPETIPSLFGIMQYSVDEGALLQSGTHTITATYSLLPKYIKNYLPATVTAELEVRRFTPSLSWARPPKMIFGYDKLSAAHLNAQLELSTFLVDVHEVELTAVTEQYTGTHDSSNRHTSAKRQRQQIMVDGAFSYVPTFGEELPHAGNHVLRAVFTPTDSLNFGSCEASQVVTVVRSRPVVAWDAPPAIYWGSTLSGKQLNATVSCPGLLATDGEFVYSPPRGELLPVGTHILRADFIPHVHVSKNFDCSDCSVRVPLVVRPKPFNMESLDRLLLVKRQSMMHSRLHTADINHTQVCNHPTRAMTKVTMYNAATTGRGSDRPTSAPYTGYYPVSGPRWAWPKSVDERSDSESDDADRSAHVLTFGGRKRDPNQRRPLSAYSIDKSLAVGFTDSLASPNGSVEVDGFSISSIAEQRRTTSAESALSPTCRVRGWKQLETMFPPLFDEDGSLLRPVTAQSKLEAATFSRRGRPGTLDTRFDSADPSRRAKSSSHASRTPPRQAAVVDSDALFSPFSVALPGRGSGRVTLDSKARPSTGNRNSSTTSPIRTTRVKSS